MKGPARLLLAAGAAAAALWLLRASPREVTLVYAFARAPERLEVEVLRDGQALRRAEFRLPAGGPGQVRHPLRLPDGEYRLLAHFAGPDGSPRAVERPLTVSESGTVVVPLGE